MYLETSINELENDFNSPANDLLLQTVQHKIESKIQKNKPITAKRLKLSNFTEKTVFYEMLKYYDATISSPFEFIATNLLTISSGVIGKWRYIEQGNNKLFLNLYAIIIGNSTSSRKTTSITSILKDLNPIEEEIKAKNKAKNDVTESGDKPIKHKLPNEYLTLPAKVTEEALFEILSNNSRGLQWFSEFKSFVANLEKSYNSGFKAQLTDIYDGNRIITATKGGGEISVSEPFISILAATTIEWLSYGESSLDLSSGFLTRFIYCRVYNNIKPYVPLLEMKNRYYDTTKYDCSSVFKRLYDLSVNGTEQRSIDFSETAKNLFTQYDMKIYTESNSINNDTLQSFYGRLIVSVAKISGIISLINNHDIITESDVKDAIELGEFFKYNIQDILSSGISSSRLGTAINKVIALFQSGKTEITRSEITTLFKNDGGSKFANDVINTLKDMNLIEEITSKSPNAKRQTTAYVYIGNN